MDGEHEARAGLVQRLDDAAQPLGLGVCLSVEGQDRVRAVCRRWAVLRRERREQPGRISHHVADDDAAAPYAL
jgi:hypothetical protein